MRPEYLTRLIRTSLVLGVMLLIASTPSHPSKHSHQHGHAPYTVKRAIGAGPMNDDGAVDSLYSRRALMRLRYVLQMRLFELRKERLDRVEQAIEHNLSSDTFLDPQVFPRQHRAHDPTPRQHPYPPERIRHLR